ACAAGRMHGERPARAFHRMPSRIIWRAWKAREMRRARGRAARRTGKGTAINEKPAAESGAAAPEGEAVQRSLRRHRLSAQDRFIDWFQSVAPYIHAFRGKRFVIAFGGEVFADGRFLDLTHDLNLLAALGVRLVLVHGT